MDTSIDSHRCVSFNKKESVQYSDQTTLPKFRYVVLLSSFVLHV